MANLSETQKQMLEGVPQLSTQALWTWDTTYRNRFDDGCLMAFEKAMWRKVRDELRTR